jgi:hypothetical protein
MNMTLGLLMMINWYLYQKSRDSSVGIATRLLAGRSGVLGFDSRRGLGMFLLTTATRTALGPTQHPIQWVPGALSLRIKRPDCEANHIPSSNAEVKEWVELYLHSPNTPSWRGVQLKRHRATLPLHLHAIAMVSLVYSGVCADTWERFTIIPVKLATTKCVKYRYLESHAYILDVPSSNLWPKLTQI